MSGYENKKMPQLPASSSLVGPETNVDENNFDVSKVDNTKSDNAKNAENNGGKKAKLCFQLTEVESLLFFNIIRFNRRPDEVDWAKVAEHSDLKLRSVKVRFRQVLTKHGLSHLMPTPHRKCGEASGQRRSRKTKNEAVGVAAASQDDGDGDGDGGFCISPEKQNPGAGDVQVAGAETQAAIPQIQTAFPSTQPAIPQTQFDAPGSQYALSDPQAQDQTPQFGNGVKIETARPSPVVNEHGFSSLFALPSSQQQQQQQQQLPATTLGDPANIGPFNHFFNPSVPSGLAPVDTSGNVGTSLSMTATADQPREGQTQVANRKIMQPSVYSGNVEGLQQMGDSNNIGDMPGMGANTSSQSTQMNNQHAGNNCGTKRYIQFKFVDDPRPYLGNPNVKAHYSHAHGKWRVETIMHIDQDLDSDYDI
ncbi:hypothetical protein VMCG_04428 [Cytospora schulzeri]|uniref:Myb-like domain-containing protein n=1 Tax=Cytospora schulzeri TaxID=448051 RepID=A0A423WSU8_9PEZI|nr:hypothetical protein VMCG_04428 [Valsa malicola]